MKKTIWNRQWRGKHQEEQLWVRSDQRGLLSQLISNPRQIYDRVSHLSVCLHLMDHHELAYIQSIYEYISQDYYS